MSVGSQAIRHVWTYVDKQCVNFFIPTVDHLVAVSLHSVRYVLPGFLTLVIGEERLPSIPVTLHLG